MANLLFEKADYQIEKTRFGTWRRYMYPNGMMFREFKSHRRYFNMPLVHYTSGKCPETGRRIVARGIIACGRLAFGGLAVGHASLGLIAIGQAGLGILLGLGQLATGWSALGQLAVGLKFGAGQLAMGQTAVGQLAWGRYVLAQLGLGTHVWSTGSADPVAVEYFHALFHRLINFF